jgi:hypothetical protein
MTAEQHVTYGTHAQSLPRRRTSAPGETHRGHKKYDSAFALQLLKPQTDPETFSIAITSLFLLPRSTAADLHAGKYRDGNTYLKWVRPPHLWEATQAVAR